MHTHCSRSGIAVHRPVHRLQTTRTAAAKWQVFGPRSSYSDGDAEYFRLTNQLADQYEWFAPGSEEEAADEQQQQQQDERKPLYGLTPQQIAALGLTGPGINTPDPVSSSCWLALCSSPGSWDQCLAC